MIKHVFAYTTAGLALVIIVLLMVLPTPIEQVRDVNKTLNNANISHNIEFITNVTVFNGEAFIPEMSVELENGLIKKIDSADAMSADINDSVNVLDATGLTMLPGLIDAHTHTWGNGLADTLRFGVSTHLDMFTNESLLVNTRSDRENLQEFKRADLFSSGTLATVDKGHGTQFGFAIDTIATISDIAPFVAKRKAQGADYIKLVYMPYQNYMPSLSLALAEELVKQAHAHDMLALAHISSQQAALDMINANIDGLVHIFADSIASPEIIALAKNKGVFIIPTLSVIDGVDKAATAKQVLANPSVRKMMSSAQLGTLQTSYPYAGSAFSIAKAQQNVALFHEAGVAILSGSDAPNPSTAYGVSAHTEMQLLHASGLSIVEAINAASLLPAKLFALDDRGSIEIGKRADFMLVPNSISTNIKSSLALKHVFKNGHRVNIQVPVANDPPTAQSDVLGNFEQNSLENVETLPDFIWSESNDKMAGGNSSAALSLTSGGANNTSQSLHVTGAIEAGFAFPWAGAAVGDFIAPVSGLNISAYSHLEFWIKGTPGKYQVMAFDAGFASGNARIPANQHFTITQTWQKVSLPLDNFDNFNLKAFAGLAFVAGSELSEFEFYIDEIRV